MKLSRLEIDNYRSIEKLDLAFPTFYSAISGRNNAGKTNIIRAIRVLLREQNPFRFYRGDEDSVDYVDDYPLWKAKTSPKEAIKISLTLEISPHSDAGMHRFITKLASIPETPDAIVLQLAAAFTEQKADSQVVASINGLVQDEFISREILKKIQGASAVLFHNSTELDDYRRYPYGAGSGIISEFSPADRQELVQAQARLSRFFDKMAKKHQKDIADLMGRLEEQYNVGLSLGKIDFEFLPMEVSLGEKKFSVPLKDWGSGTKNRTHILLTLLRARKIVEAAEISDRIAPILIIEEPESFLHPSAQAEFGRILQDLAEEFQIQVIATTHSPYLLSQRQPGANILVEKRSASGRPGETCIVDTSENWADPFSLALGVSDAEFLPLRDILFGGSNKILLVEGDIDKEYFELLKDEAHGKNRLTFAGEVFPYGGKDTLKNTILLRFIMTRYSAMFITFDLDCVGEVERTLTGLSFKRGDHYLPIGVDASGKRDIEGLLPDSVRSAVYGANPDLVQQAVNGDAQERRSAKSNLKRLLLEEFRRVAVPGEEYFGGFYKLVKAVNKALG